MVSPLTASTVPKEQAVMSKKKKRVTRRKRKEPQPHQAINDDDVDDEEQRLMSTLFGTKNDSTESLTHFQNHTKKTKRPESNGKVASANEFTFEIDRVGNTIPSDDVDDKNNTDPDSKKQVEDKQAAVTIATRTATTPNKITKKTAAWVDHDDTTVGDGRVHFVNAADRIRKLRQHRQETHVENRSLYEERLRQRYLQTTQTTSNVTWAQPTTTTTTTGDDDAVIRDHHPEMSISTSYLKDHSTTTTTTTTIPPHLIYMKRCPDVNRNDPHQSVTKVVNFYRPTTSLSSTSNAYDESPTLLLTAGLDKTLRFFHCSDEASTKIHGVHCTYPTLYFEWFPFIPRVFSSCAMKLNLTNLLWRYFFLLFVAIPVPNFPIYSASFIGSSSNVVVTGRRPFFYIYDTVADNVQQISKIQNRHEKSWERCVVSPHDNNTVALLGNDGYIILYNILQQKPWTTQPIKLNGSVRTVAFNQHNSNELLASGSDGDIYRYDLRNPSQYKCHERFHNDDGTITSQIATSSQTFAVGAESGVVNIYQNNRNHTERVRSPSLLRGLSTTTTTTTQFATPPRKPMHSIMNMKTCVDTMTYNHDGNLLAIASRFEKDSLKLVHVPTGTVYSNWPTSNTPLGYVFSLDFSPYSNYMAIGNDQGRCLLYKLIHYE